MSLCIATLIGRVGQEPRSSMTPSGKAVCSFSLAIDEGYKDNKKTFWINVSVFGQQAEICNKWVHQGATLAITGRLGMNEYTDKNGQKTQKPQVIAEHIEFLSSKSSAGNYGAQTQVPPPAQQYGQQQGYGAPQNAQPPFPPMQTAETPPDGVASEPNMSF